MKPHIRIDGLIGKRNLGFVLGTSLFVAMACVPPPAGLATEAFRMLSIVGLMTIWWITEAVPISITALIPIVAYPLLGIMSTKAAAAPYANDTLYLFLGGFTLAVAMQRWGLHRRIALLIMSHIRPTPRFIVFGFMLVSAILSMWVSNTATAVMLLPIAMAIIARVTGRDEPIQDPSSPKEKAWHNFAVSLFLGIAYAASIGGIGTLVGTPPNIVLAGMLPRLVPGAPEVSFVKWMVIGIPVAVLFIPIVWAVLTIVLYPAERVHFEMDRRHLREEYKALGPASRAERWVLSVFALTAGMWIFRSDIDLGIGVIPGWSRLFSHPEFIRDSTVAIFMAIVLFCIPVGSKDRKFLLDREWYKRIPWNILLLFGGGFALAEGFKVTGLSEWIGSHLVVLEGAPTWGIVAGTCFLMTFLTEVTSNTTTTTVMLPILASASAAIGIDPLLLMVPATISASCAFMLPVATPPNAIAFGSGVLTIPKMARAGIVLNLIGILLVTLVTGLVVPRLF